MPRTGDEVLRLSLEFTLYWEGGVSDHVDDLGGLTNRGITQQTYDLWRASKGLLGRSVVECDLKEATAIYRQDYWRLGALSEQLADELEIVHFDTCVMHGTTGANIFLQELFGLSQDGVFGPKTKASLLANNNLQVALLYCDNRLKYRDRRIKENPSQRSFLEGWKNRDRALKDYVSKLGGRP